MTEAHLTVLEGVFYVEGDRMMVADEKLGTVDVNATLEKTMGKPVVLAAHHKPVDPPDKERWAGGCCLHEPSGKCPAGHHDRPGWLYTFYEAGTLVRHDNKWFVQKEGKLIEVLLSLLPGHRAQIVVSSIPTEEELKDTIGDYPTEAPDIDSIMERVQGLRDLLVQVNQMKDKL